VVDLVDHYWRGQADNIVLTNRKTGATQNKPYPEMLLSEGGEPVEL
jgi:hypothetical protein